MFYPSLSGETDSDSSSDISFESISQSSISSISSIDSVIETGSTMSTSSRSSRSNTARNNASQSSNSSTEEYEIPRVLLGNRGRRNATGPPGIPPPPPIITFAQPANQTDDDVVLIAPEIETIDLCTQAVVANIPANLHNEIIDITDSPVQNVQPVVAGRTRNSHNNAEGGAAGPVRNRRGGTRTSPYERGAATSTPIPQPSTSNAPQLDIEDSFQSQANAIKYSCPICLESVKNREPVSTMCGHVFCKVCIRAALQQAKKCPMCKKNLNAKNPFIQIFID